MTLVAILLPGGSGYAHCRFFAPLPISHRLRPSFDLAEAAQLGGFKPDEVDVTVEQNVLTLDSRKAKSTSGLSCITGISARNIKCLFTLPLQEHEAEAKADDLVRKRDLPSSNR